MIPFKFITVSTAKHTNMHPLFYLVFIATLPSGIFSTDYKIQKVEKCLSSDVKVFELKKCTATQKSLTVVVDFKKSLNKFYVNFNMILKEIFELVSFIRFLLRFSHWNKMVNFFKFSKHLKLNGVDWWQAQKVQTHWRKEW